MTKEIEDLARKSGLLGRKFMFGQYFDEELTDEQKKFAELLIRGCADFVQFYYKDHACEMIAHDMKQHYGITR